MSQKVMGVRDYFNQAYQERSPRQHEWTAGTANPEIVNLVYEGIIPVGSKVLEIGCGLGTESIFLAVRGMNVTALDISAEAIEVGRRLANAYDVEVDWRVGDVLKMEVADKEYDVVSDQGCFHHMTNEERPQYLQEVLRVLKPGGMFILRCFSDKIPGGPQPRRISSDELLDMFHPALKLEHMELILSFSTEQRTRPQGWFTIWYKRS